MSATEKAGADIQPIAGIDRLVHEPARLMILTILYVVKSADFLYLMRQTGLTRGNLSSHLSKLEAADYIDVEKEFVDRIPRTLLHLTDTGRQAFQTYRQDMIQVLEDLAD
ncbi:MAG: transcriptional regulator [Anaerolineae bacterium]|jgi:DNA-binding MarR family transcriptional regulator